MVFNFDKPETKDFTETVRLLANLSHFVIVDITNPGRRRLSYGGRAGVHDPVRPDPSGRRETLRDVRRLQTKFDWVLQPVIGQSPRVSGQLNPNWVNNSGGWNRGGCLRYAMVNKCQVRYDTRDFQCKCVGQ
jgi:hypothetical protein